ncbi:MAG TPA: hypothetical protein VFX03_07675, partial [Thermomicrobiales bacterium]|nr:hypothetical protein [Thermomicrobiales bacterium]
HFGQDITLLAPSGDKIVDGQTFQIHGTTFEFDNLNSPATVGVLPGDVAIRYFGTPFNNPSPQPIDAPSQLAAKIAAAINGAQLGQPALFQGSGSQTAQTAALVDAAVTGNQVTITNVAMNSAVALQVPASGIQAGQTFVIKGTVFQFFSGDALKLDAASGNSLVDGDTFTIKSGASGATVTFEFALNGRAVIDGAWPISYTKADSTETLGRAISAAIDAAQAAGAFAKAPLGTWAAAPPVLQPLTASAGGVLSVGATYFYYVTALGASGETLASNERSLTVAGGNQTLNLTWTAVAGAASYKIYRGNAAGGENTLIASVASGATT